MKTFLYVLKIIGLLVVSLAIVGVVGYYAIGFLSEDTGETQRFVEKMGPGINVGNSLDVTGFKGTLSRNGESCEEAWGNPKLTPKLFDAVYAGGFRTVRIPVSWGDHVDDGYYVDPAWMKRVHEVVDMALDSGLYVIIDSHHEPWRSLVVRNDGVIRFRHITLWRQIAEEFRDYDERLLFEGMNEPRLIDSEMEWTDGDAKLRGFVNELNGDFVDTVRATGGNNEKRYLLVTSYAGKASWETVAPLMDFLDERKWDRRLIASLHMYEPYSFCQDENGTAEWSAEVPEDIEGIEDGLAVMLRLRSSGYSVILSEYGAKAKDNDDARIRWTNYHAARCNYNGIGRIWWDDGSEYALIDRETRLWINPALNAAAAYYGSK